MGVPLEARNKLYALFAESLREGGAAAFARKARGFKPEDSTYIKERVPRYKRALQRCAKLRTADPLSRHLEIWRILFNEGLFFDSHEYLEGAWKRSSGEERIMLQGLIQAGAAFHKLELGSSTGCAELLGKAAAKLLSLKSPRWSLLRPFAVKLEKARGSDLHAFPRF